MIVALFLSDSTSIRFLCCLKNFIVVSDICSSLLSVWFSLLWLFSSSFIRFPIFLASFLCSIWCNLRMVLA